MCAWGSDTGAYLVGRKIGKHKLAPALSPHKSIEGSIGGMISAAILCGLYCWLSGKFDLKLIPAFCLIGVVGSIFGQLGDLAASSIKRYTGIKTMVILCLVMVECLIDLTVCCLHSQ